MKVKRTRICVWFVAVVVLVPAAGCGGDDDRDQDRAAKAVDGTFVGKVSGTNAFVAVVASPAARGQDRRAVNVYVSDGRRLSAGFTGSAQGNSFTAASDGGDQEAKGKLSGDRVTGTVELPDGKTAKYQATQATAASGLYDLTVSSRGKLSGASAAGVGLTSASELQAPGTGKLKFADGKRRTVDITGGDGSDPVRVRASEIRLIVLQDGAMTGAGGSGSSAAADPDFFLRSTSG